MQIEFQKETKRIVVRDFDINEDGDVTNIEMSGLECIDMNQDVAFFDIVDTDWHICKLDGIGQTEYCRE